MRHRVFGRKLSRDTGHRIALRRNLIRALFEHERIETTKAKAKAIRPEAEKLITLAKRCDQSRLTNLAKAGNVDRLAAMVRRHNAEKLVSLASDGKEEDLKGLATGLALHARRQLYQKVPDKTVADKLIHVLASDYFDRPGGYTRLLNIGPRQGDAAEMVLLELVH